MRRMFAVLVVTSAVAHAALPESLTLDEALALAKERLPSLRVAQAQANLAQARSREAMAPLLPTISMGLAYSRQTSNFAPQPGQLPSSLSQASAVSFDSANFFSGNLTAQVTLWDFGQNWNRWQSSLSSSQAQEAQLHASQVAAALQVRTSFFNALAQRELMDVARTTLANAEVHLKQVEGFVKVETKPEIDLAQSRADRANARLALLNATNAYAVAKARLNQAMGYEGPSSYEVQGAPPPPVESEDAADALLDSALKARPEVAALEAQLKAQDFSMRSTWGNYWPTLGLSLGGTVRGQALDRLAPNLSAQVTLNWQLWSGGATNAQMAQAEASLAVLRAQRDGLTQQVRLDVEQARLTVGAAREGVDVSQEALTAAAERLRLAQGRYNAGMGSAIELGDAQLAYTQAASQKVQAVYSLATARAQLLAAVGRLD